MSISFLPPGLYITNSDSVSDDRSDTERDVNVPNVDIVPHEAHESTDNLDSLEFESQQTVLNPVELHDKLVIVSQFASKVASKLSTFAGTVTYAKCPDLRIVVAEFKALHMTLSNLSDGWDPATTDLPSNQWLDTLDLMLQITNDPLEALDTTLNTELKGSWNLWARRKEKLQLGESVGRDYQRRTVSYTQMLNMLYVSLSSEDFARQQQGIIDRILGLVAGPKAQKQDLGNWDIRLLDSDPTEVLGHWTPEIILKDRFALPDATSLNKEFMIEKNKPDRRIYIHIMQGTQRETYIVTRQSRCERGVGNDPIIITKLKKVGDADTIDSLYLFVDTWLARDSIVLTITTLRWLPAEWFPSNRSSVNKGKGRWRRWTESKAGENIATET